MSSDTVHYEDYLKINNYDSRTFTEYFPRRYFFASGHFAPLGFVRENIALYVCLFFFYIGGYVWNCVVGHLPLPLPCTNAVLFLYYCLLVLTTLGMKGNKNFLSTINSLHRSLHCAVIQCSLPV